MIFCAKFLLKIGISTLVLIPPYVNLLYGNEYETISSQMKKGPEATYLVILLRIQ